MKKDLIYAQRNLPIFGLTQEKRRRRAVNLNRRCQVSRNGRVAYLKKIKTFTGFSDFREISV